MRSVNSLMVMLCSFSLVGLLVLLSPGCGSLQSGGHGDLLVRVAVSQGVVRFVDEGGTAADRAYRKESLISALSIARQYVDSGQPLEVLNWSDEFIRLMNWDSLSVADQFLLMELIEFVRIEIDARLGESDTRIYLSRLIDLSISVAQEL